MDAAISCCYIRRDENSVHIDAGDLRIVVSAQEARQALQREALVDPLSGVSRGDKATNGGAARFSRIVVDISFGDRHMCPQLHDAVAVMFSGSGASRPAQRVADMENEHGSEDIREPGSFLALLSDLGTSELVERAADMEDEGLSRVSRELSSFFCELGRFLEFTRSWSSKNLREELTGEANLIHNAMKQFWADTYDTGHDDDLRSHLARILFMKRKRVESADASQLGLACASQEETWRAIRDVLELRQSYLKSKGIKDLRHVLTSDERIELTKRARADYEDSEEQRILQDLDIRNGKARGKQWRGKGALRRSKAKSEDDGKGACFRGAPQPARGKGKPKSKCHQKVGTGSLDTFLEAQKGKRWRRHLQRICGTKQIWEILAFTGRFEADKLREALRSSEQDGDVEEETQDVDGQYWRRLLRARAEAQASYNRGRRLARQRDAHRDPSRSQRSFTAARRSRLAPRSSQWNLLQRWDSGELRRELNEAVAACGHRPLGSGHGELSDIRDSTGGGSWRLVDGWVPLERQEFSPHSDRD